MEATRPAPLNGAAHDSAQLAKAALRRLALAKLEPTPENYRRAWRQEAGEPPEPPQDRPEPPNDGPAIAGLIERIVRGLERGSRGWTAARKKESLQRVLDGSRSDARRLQQRLGQLVGSWDDASAADEPEPSGADAVRPESPGPVQPERIAEPSPAAPWGRAVGALGGAVKAALPPARSVAAAEAGGAAEPAGTGEAVPTGDPAAMVEARAGGDAHASDAVAAIADLVRAIVDQGPNESRVAALESRCAEAVPTLQHRHRLLDQLNALCGELAASLAELAEDESWARGQCEAMRAKLDEGLSARGIRAVSELLRDTRERQSALKGERERARESLKVLIARMLAELDELGSRTGQFHDSVGRYAGIIERADTLESLTGVVREMVEESRSVQTLVQQTQARLSEEHGRTLGLSKRVIELESEMERLSSEVATDQLTQVANRRGLQQAFEAERQRLGDAGGALVVGLLDIDNFKRLNDELGHGAGDEALRSLAGVVSRALRPGDHVARYGGEEFVVLLPDTSVEVGQQILTRLQRSLTGGLFLHESRQVFVTFSAGVTAYRAPERIEAALERADQALYGAKRSGKNRTCIG